jgi:arginine/serine-rich splicing factor 4/5/6
MSKRVYVGRLSSQARQSDVEKFFRGFGSIREVLMKRGYCFVEFDSSKDAEEAVHDMNGKTICGDK